LPVFKAIFYTASSLFFACFDRLARSNALLAIHNGSSDRPLSALTDVRNFEISGRGVVQIPRSDRNALRVRNSACTVRDKRR
jgi:hypothetical protein